MSYDIAVWAGEPPASDDAAAARYAELCNLFEEPPEELPDPTVVAFMNDLLARYPDITEDGSEDSPWSIGPMKDDILGTFTYLPMRYDKFADAMGFIVERANAHQLVCFDPQQERLLTPAAG